MSRSGFEYAIFAIRRNSSACSGIENASSVATSLYLRLDFCADSDPVAAIAPSVAADNNADVLSKNFLRLISIFHPQRRRGSMRLCACQCSRIGLGRLFETRQPESFTALHAVDPS